MRLRWAIMAVVVLVLAGGALYVQQRARMERIQKAEVEAALRRSLAEIRGAIAKYHKDNGRYPGSLDDLVPNYIRRIPPDPMSPLSPWRLTTEETVEVPNDFGGLKPAAPQGTVVIDVHSSAPGYGEY